LPLTSRGAWSALLHKHNCCRRTIKKQQIILTHQRATHSAIAHQINGAGGVDVYEINGAVSLQQLKLVSGGHGVSI
jgi:hypothetical protein